MYTLIGTAKLNDVDPQAWLADVLDRMVDLPQTRLHDLLPWNWKAERQQALAAHPAAVAGCLTWNARSLPCPDVAGACLPVPGFPVAASVM